MEGTLKSTWATPVFRYANDQVITQTFRHTCCVRVTRAFWYTPSRWASFLWQYTLWAVVLLALSGTLEVLRITTFLRHTKAHRVSSVGWYHLTLQDFVVFGRCAIVPEGVLGFL